MRHAQMVTDNISVIGSLAWWSDEFVTRDFRRNSSMTTKSPTTLRK